jgi:hypothetical protein
MQERFSFTSFVAGDPSNRSHRQFATEFEASWPIYMAGRHGGH